MKKSKRFIVATMAGIMSLSTVGTVVASAANTSLVSEKESNNTITSANSVSCNSVFQGTISSSTDVDYVAYFAPTSGYVDIQLGVPSGANYNFQICNTAGNVLYTAASYGVGYGESLTFYASASTTYFIKVYPAATTAYGGTYKLYASYPYATNAAWFPQIDAVSSSYERWNTYNLDKLFYNGSTSTPFMINASKSDQMYQGCAIASVAMVLHNLGAKTTNRIVDFRTGFNGYATADPFTVGMANIGVTSAPTTTTSGFNYQTSSNIIAINNWTNLVGAFGKTITSDVTTSTWSDITKKLAANPQGVIVKFQNSTYGPHFVVFVPASNTDGFVIYDVGTSTTAGYGKTWASSYTSTRYAKTDLQRVITIG